MAELSVTAINKTGSTLDAGLVSASAGGDSIKYASGLLFVIDNADASGKTITIVNPGNPVNCPGYGSVTIPDLTFSVNAGERIFFSVPSGYVDGGLVSITYSSVTSVTVGVFSINPEA